MAAPPAQPRGSWSWSQVLLISVTRNENSGPMAVPPVRRSACVLVVIGSAGSDREALGLDGLLLVSVLDGRALVDAREVAPPVSLSN
jgi:hypothetical protein